MPANLPPDYYAAERRYRQASSITDKIEILKDMLAIMPKHKGTEHLQGDLKKKIAKLQNQSQKRSVKGKSSHLDHIPSEGAGQVVLAGPPNSGKSSLLISLTNAHSEVADYPFSTFRPVPGMMPYEDINIQLIDLPPVSIDYQESWIFNIIRLCDLVVHTIDLSDDDAITASAAVFDLLEKHRLVLEHQGESKPQGPVAVKSTLIIGTKSDSERASHNLKKVNLRFGERFPVIPCSILKDEQLQALKKQVFENLKVIRVYTKTPGRKADYKKPYIIPRGSTVFQAAYTIHKELAEQMHFARIWGSEKYQGQRVEREHILEDKDVLEIHT